MYWYQSGLFKKRYLWLWWWFQRRRRRCPRPSNWSCWLCRREDSLLHSQHLWHAGKEQSVWVIITIITLTNRGVRGRDRVPSRLTATQQTHVSRRLEESEHVNPPPANAYVYRCLLFVCDPCRWLHKTHEVTGDGLTVSISWSTLKVTLPHGREKRYERGEEGELGGGGRELIPSVLPYLIMESYHDCVTKCCCQNQWLQLPSIT